MLEETETLTQAPEAPVADTSAADLAAAFANAQPHNPNAQPAPVEAAPVEAEPAATAPAEPVAAAPEAEAPTPATVDYAAYLKENFGVEAPEAIKTALATAKEAESFKANQRTAQDVAFEKLLADPKAANQYVKLQSTDFTALAEKNPQKLLALAYAHANPDMPAELAKVEARLEYEAKYGAASFDDPDDPQVQAAKLRLDYATKTAVATMEGAKTASREAVLNQATPMADGPTPEQTLAEETRVANWTKGVDDIINAPSLEIEYQVDGKPLKLAFDHQTPSFKEAMLDPSAWVFKQICPDGDPSKPNLDRWAVIVALAEQTDTMLKNAMQAGKAQVGAHIPMSLAVNPATSAPQAPAGMDGNHDARVAAALRSEMARITQANYN